MIENKTGFGDAEFSDDAIWTWAHSVVDLWEASLQAANVGGRPDRRR